jgi:ATP-dependent Lon protease
VLPIGGLKEKLLAAHRAGIFEAILPEDNRKDLADLPELLKTSMKLHFVEEMDQVLKIALEGKLPELKEETPEALAATVLPVGIDIPQPVSHQ